MVHEFLEEIRNELERATREKGHPMRCFAFGTRATDGTVGLRTVVLRGVDDELTFWFFTDRRSAKFREIGEDGGVSALFYHPVRQVQVKIEGVAHALSEGKEHGEHFAAVPEHSRKDYAAQVAPGTEIPGPDSVEYLDTHGNFAVIKVRPIRMDYLRLGNPSHVRVGFERRQGLWTGRFLAP